MSKTKNTKICRTCMLNTGEMRSLFATGTIMGRTTKLSDVLVACAELEIAKDDGLPQQICMRCVHQVSRSFCFKKQCEANQKTLLYKLKNPTLKQTKVSSSTIRACPENITLKQEKLEEILGENEEVTLTLDEEVIYDSLETDNLIDDVEYEVETLDEKPLMPVNNDTPSKPALPTVAPKTFNPFQSRNNVSNKCKTCGRVFHLLSALRLHCFRDHRGSPDFPKCKLCGKMCRSEEQMKRHMNIHNTGKPFQCELCPKTFCQRAAYVAHTYSHTGERPFLCTECGKTFKQNSELKIHMRMHLDLRPYSCDICGKNYRNSSLFAIHKRVHSGERPFHCTYCDKKFISSSCLKNHVMIHTGEKPFTCDYCGRSFNRSNALRIHRKIHTGERPFVCTICGKGFIQSHCLQTHLNTHKDKTT